MIRFFAILFLAQTYFVSHAHALSCVQFTPDMLFETMKETSFVVVKGRIEFDGRFNPTREQAISGDVGNGLFQSKTAKLEGVLLSDGSDFERDIDVQQYCTSVWCGSVQSQTQGVFLLDKTDDEYVLPLFSCGGRIYGNLSDKDLNTLAECFQSGECVYKEFNKEEKK